MTTAWRPAGRLIDLDAPGPSRTLAPPAAAALVATALAAEPGAVLLRSSPRARAILAGLPRGTPAIAVLPDMAQLLRDISDRGPARAALERLSGGGLPAWWRVGTTALRHLRQVAAQDLTGIAPVLIELERSGLAHASVRGVALAAPMTDLLLATGHGECLRHTMTFLRTRTGLAAGFETLNLGHLLHRLRRWNVAADFVVGPFNARGFRMKPSRRRVRAAVEQAATPLLATEVSAGRTLRPVRGAAWARAHGAAGVVLTLDDLQASDTTPSEAAPA